jgi:regulator of cell morphogenesis and NO signaling
LTLNSEMSMRIHKNDTVGLIAARNFQAASVFNYYGIDFYLKGDRSLEHACLDDNVAMPVLLEELSELKDKSGSRDFQSMNLMDLSVYILRTHHNFTEKRVVFINHTLDRLIREYPNDRMDIRRIKKTFEDLSIYLTVHLKHEEFVIFPFIQKMVKARTTVFPKFESLEHPIASMKDDHKHEASVLKTLATLTNNYALPANSDYALKIAFAAMKELEDDLKIHMHLENNILFPGAIRLAGTINTRLN